MSPQPLDVCLYRREFRGRLGSRVQQASRTIWIRGSGLSPLHVYKSAVARPRRVCTVSPLSCLPAEYRPQRKTPAQYTRAYLSLLLVLNGPNRISSDDDGECTFVHSHFRSKVSATRVLTGRDDCYLNVTTVLLLRDGHAAIALKILKAHDLPPMTHALALDGYLTSWTTKGEEADEGLTSLPRRLLLLLMPTSLPT
ncbi:hypothetical protein E4U34_004250 [Claviceps purpurea]|nr:hypothetical protein E4U34_004250 [Claviceps purpurea]